MKRLCEWGLIIYQATFKWILIDDGVHTDVAQAVEGEGADEDVGVADVVDERLRPAERGQRRQRARRQRAAHLRQRAVQLHYAPATHKLLCYMLAGALILTSLPFHLFIISRAYRYRKYTSLPPSNS